MDWISRFPGLSSLESGVRARLQERARVVQLPRGSVIFGPGKPPENLLLLIEGSLRVSQTSESGREIVLYRVHAGESCVMTTACLLAHEEYNAEAVAETDLTAVAIPRATFDELIATSKTFRTFVFSAFSSRMTDLFYAIEELAFRRVDIRLAQRLLELAGTAGSVHATHAMMAAELGTAREVVSRQLSDFQRRDMVALARGEIRLTDRPALERLAEQA